MYTIELDYHETLSLKLAAQRKMDYYAEQLTISLKNNADADVWYRGMMNLGSAWKKIQDATDA